MKISEYITKLQDFQNEHGDLEVYMTGDPEADYEDLMTPPDPVVDWKSRPTSPGTFLPDPPDHYDVCRLD